MTVQKAGTERHLFDAVWTGRHVRQPAKEMNQAASHERSVITITERIFTMLFWQEFLQEPDIWWNPIRNMGKDEAM